MAFINELPADEIADLLDKYVAEEYGHEVENWTVEVPLDADGFGVGIEDCRFRFRWSWAKVWM